MPSNSRFRKLHPVMMDEILMMSKEARNGGYGLLMVAGLFRDTMPWISEILVEAHRELKNASPQQAKSVASDLRRTLKYMTRSHFAEMMMNDSKHLHMMLMELPHMIERFVERIEFRQNRGNVDSDIEGNDDQV